MITLGETANQAERYDMSAVSGFNVNSLFFF